jgi:hypothetical protein
VSVKISVDMDGLTLGDLYVLVDNARRSGKSPSEKVTQVEIPDFQEPVIDRLEIEVESVGGPAGCYIEADPARRYLAAIEDVIASEGDARGALSDLQELRDALLRGI